MSKHHAKNAGSASELKAASGVLRSLKHTGLPWQAAASGFRQLAGQRAGYGQLSMLPAREIWDSGQNTLICKHWSASNFEKYFMHVDRGLPPTACSVQPLT